MIYTFTADKIGLVAAMLIGCVGLAVLVVMTDADGNLRIK